MALTAVYDDKWTLAVVHWVNNQTFRFPLHGIKLKFGTAVWTPSQNLTTITLHASSNYYNSMDGVIPTWNNNVNAPLFDRLVKYLVLENSSGQRERILVHYGTGNIIYCHGQLVYSYAAASDMTIMSIASPAGFGVNGRPFTRELYWHGSGDRASLKMISLDTAFAWFAQYMQGLREGITYELRLMYKLVNDFSSPFAVRVVSDSATFLNVTIQSSSINDDWQELGGSAVKGSVENTFPAEVLVIKSIVATPSTNPLFVDNLVLGHARGTVDEASAKYTFTDYPESVSWSDRAVLPPAKLKSGYGSNRIEYGNMVKRRKVVRASFKDVSESFLQNLMVLKSWQDRGYALCLQTPYPDLKPWIVGFMSIDSIGKRVEDLSKNSFSFVFVEA